MMLTANQINHNYIVHQLKLSLEIEKIIDISAPVYTFCEVVDHIDLSEYFVEKGYKKGRPRCDGQKLLECIHGVLLRMNRSIQTNIKDKEIL